MADGGSVDAPRVGLLVTCLVDVFRPAVGFAAVRLLEEAGCSVDVPSTQTCCGQPALSGGDRETARRAARRMVDAFEGCTYLVAPSGSCLATVRRHVPQLLAGEPAYAGRAVALASRSWELLTFLHDVRSFQVPREASRAFPYTVTYHDSCTGLRELGVGDQPRALLQGVPELRLVEMEENEACCGFGGTFCIDYPEISTRMVAEKIGHAADTAAEVLVGGDVGCLMNLAGYARRQGRSLRVLHAAEVLAGMGDAPALGEETP